MVFCNSPLAGAVIMGGLALGDPMLAALAGTGAATATVTAMLAGLDAGAVKDGLMGYNGALVGCAFAVFLPMAGIHGLVPAAATVAGAAVSPFVALACARAMGSVPHWTLAFNAVALAGLLRVQPLAASAAAATDGPAAAVPGAFDLLMSPLVGISQIFVVDSAAAGAFIFAGVATYSPLCAASLLGGSAVGALTSALLGAQAADIAHGLCGFNPALTSLAVSVFFVPTPAAVALSIGGAATTAVATAGINTAIGGALGTPMLTLPFCVAATGCYMLEGNVSGLVLASSPHSPEMNEAPSPSSADRGTGTTENDSNRQK